jgi:hypothetical protein
MMIMGNFKKLYVGAIESEVEASLLYDHVAILSHGLKVIKLIKSQINFRLKPIMTIRKHK